MFDNIGGRIRTLARFICFAGLVISGIGMIAIWITGGGMAGRGGFTIFVVGLMTGALGALASWVAGCLIFGFGQLIEDTRVLRQTCEDTQYCAESLRRMGEELRRGAPYRENIPEDAA